MVLIFAIRCQLVYQQKSGDTFYCLIFAKLWYMEDYTITHSSNIAIHRSYRYHIKLACRMLRNEHTTLLTFLEWISREASEKFRRNRKCLSGWMWSYSNGSDKGSNFQYVHVNEKLLKLRTLFRTILEINLKLKKNKILVKKVSFIQSTVYIINEAHRKIQNFTKHDSKVFFHYIKQNTKNAV